jgi:two-component system, OmpR family, phosphate regulon sensor histidine kinase PhoR
VSRSDPVMKTPGEDRSALFFKPSVLVVDDEKRIRDVCLKMLTGEGHEVAEAENAEAGIRMIDNKHFDIILLDLMMPGISGIDALVQIRAAHPDTVVIVITGYATLEHSIEAMKKGAFDFLSKPFSPGDLLIVINRAVEHIRTLQDIATEKSRMRVMINQLTDGVMTTDNQKRIAQANPAFLKMIGYHGPRPIGRAVDEIVGIKLLNGMIDRVLDAPEDEFIEVSEEVCLESDAKSAEIVIGAHSVPFRDRLGRNLGTITVLHDITALKKMDQLKSDFVSMVSHEIRSPLNSVVMQLKVVLDGLAGETTLKQRDILGRASEKIAALITLTSELLDLAKIESGLITREREEIRIAQLLEDQVAFHQAAARAKSIQLCIEHLPALPTLMANRLNLEEVFSNLIGNAINYTPENGKITIAASVESDYVCVRITDTGIGIAEEDLDRIFDRFYRIKNAKTRFVIGTGLGLPIVKSIVDAHHGILRVESKPDHGTTFSVLFPCTPSASK